MTGWREPSERSLFRSYRNKLDRAVLQVADSTSARRFDKRQPRSGPDTWVTHRSGCVCPVRTVTQVSGCSSSIIIMQRIRCFSFWTAPPKNPCSRGNCAIGLQTRGSVSVSLSAKKKCFILRLHLRRGRKTRATWRNPRKCPPVDARFPQPQITGRLTRKCPVCRRE
jgi:hypothetical protein